MNMSNILDYGEEVEHLEQVGPKLMKIQCLVTDCDKTPKVSLRAEKNNKLFIQFLCKQHFELWESDQLDHGLRIECNIIKDINPQTLQQTKKNNLNQAINTLDRYPCCMRENIKFQNIKTIYTFYSLVSNEDKKLQELLKRYQEEKFHHYKEIKQQLNEIRNGQKQFNVLQALIQIQKLDNLSNNKGFEATIQDSELISKIQSSIRSSKIQSLDEYDR